MKIAFVSQNFYPEQLSNNAIVQNLVAAGNQVRVMTAVPNYPKGVFFSGYSNRQNRTEDWSGAHIERVFTVARGNRFWQLALNYMVFAIFGMWAAAFGRRDKPDVVFASQLSPILMCLPGIVLARRFKVPLVYWVQDIWPESLLYTLDLKAPWLSRPLTVVCGWIYRQADIVMVQSTAFPPMLERFGVPSKKIVFLPNTAPKGYVPLPRKTSGHIAELMPQTGFRLMFAGNIGEGQDFDTYLQTASLLKEKHDLHWIILGDGRNRPHVEAEILKRGLDKKFHLLGHHNKEDMPEFFAQSDAMLVGLKDTPIYAITIPYKVQCYLACGRPIVGSVNGEGRKIINRARAGVTAPAQNPAALAAAITTLIQETPMTREAMGQNARNYFDTHFSADVVYEILNRTLQDAVEKQLSR